MRLAVPVILASALVGCGSGLPAYPLMDPDAAWSLMAARADDITTVSGAADATLTGPDGTTLRLDVALAMADPPASRAPTGAPRPLAGPARTAAADA